MGHQIIHVGSTLNTGNVEGDGVERLVRSSSAGALDCGWGVVDILFVVKAFGT